MAVQASDDGDGDGDGDGDDGEVAEVDEDEDELPQSLCVDAGLRMPETARSVVQTKLMILVQGTSIR